MKKGLLFLLLTISCQTLFAQKEEWTKQFEVTKEAAAMDDAFYENPEASLIPPIITKYQEALNLLKQVESKSSDYTDAIAYRRAWIYTAIAYLFSEIEDLKKQEEFVNKAFSHWPSYSSISQYSAEKHLKFNDANPLDVQFTKMIYLGAWAAYDNKHYSRSYELEKLYEPVKKGINAYNEFAIYYDIARTYDVEKSAQEKATHWISALEKWPALDSDDKKSNEGPLNSMVSGINKLSITDNSVQLRGAKALYNAEKYAEANKLYSAYAKSAGSPTLEAGWDYSESAMKENDKTDARNAVNIIERHTSGFSTYEWERLAKVYDFIGDQARKQEILNKIEEIRRKEEEDRRLQAQRDEEERKRREKEDRKRDARGRFSLAVATNPLMYIWSDYPVSLDIRIGRIMQEFRVNFANTRDGKTDKFRFGQWNAKGAAKEFGYSYSGMEYSYTLKILAKSMETKTVGRRKQISGGYFGMQPRYSTYDFASTPYTFQDANFTTQTFNNVSASATRYDFCLLAGFIGDNLGGFFHVDYYFGAGIGYKKLDITSTDPNFKYDDYIFDDNVDRRFDRERWNKIYVPVRFGFRIGINLL